MTSQPDDQYQSWRDEQDRLAREPKAAPDSAAVPSAAPQGDDPIEQARMALEVWSNEPPYGTALHDTTTPRSAAVHLRTLFAALSAAQADNARLYDEVARLQVALAREKHRNAFQVADAETVWDAIHAPLADKPDAWQPGDDPDQLPGYTYPRDDEPDGYSGPGGA